MEKFALRAANGSEIVGNLKGHPLSLLLHFSTTRGLVFNSCVAIVATVGIFLIGGIGTGTVHAGATASQWVVVVNGDSISSRTVANHFCQIRGIPSNNVVVLSGIPDRDRITLAEFRNLILKPLMEELQARGMANHIQGVAYSVDFPTSINVSVDAKKIPDLSQYLTPVASINGLTYFYRYVMTENPAYLAFDANWYARRAPQELLQPLFISEEKKAEFAELDKEKKWEPMAKILSDGASELPKELTAPTQLLAAILWARAGNSANTLKQLESAILAGWSYRQVIESLADFQFLSEDKEFLRLLRLCENAGSDYTEIRAFNARNLYSPNTIVTKDPKYGVPFLMSVVLGVSRDLGLTRDEVINNLRRSASADFMPPEGKVFFTLTSDVRTTTREPFFAQAIEKLSRHGIEAVVHKNSLPPRGTKAAGLMMGAANFSLGTEMIEFNPGAIAENLTSLGGAMTNPSQTKATDFQRQGAAITSGAVHEPYAIVNKFPHPFIFETYAAGLTSAESYYASVTCPYQLLILGDPLCQPYAKPPRFTLVMPSTVHDRNQPLSIVINLDRQNETEPSKCWVTLDGKFLAEGAFRPRINLNFQSAPVGYHELCIGVKSGDAVEHTYQQTLWVKLIEGSSDDDSRDWSCPEEFSSYEKSEILVELTGNIPSGEIQVWNRSELVATIPSDAKAIPFSLVQFGMGPVELQLRQRESDGTFVNYRSRIINILP
ncbi:hypothetical protein SH449x_000523 [Pirellulaceae bacterium SH449]